MSHDFNAAAKPATEHVDHLLHCDFIEDDDLYDLAYEGIYVDIAAARWARRQYD